ncbi:TPA: hypothetical protein QCX73_005382 [Bacillus mycoides]|nr:hypothetical protein [Bacillus mycoides]HDR7630676.1 hypothetical protein [Bacillus mycoides]
MKKVFLKPSYITIGILFLSALSLFSDIAGLTGFNIVDYIKTYSPLSIWICAGLIIIIYLSLVVIEFFRYSKELHTKNKLSEQRLQALDDTIVNTFNPQSIEHIMEVINEYCQSDKWYSVRDLHRIIREEKHVTLSYDYVPVILEKLGEKNYVEIHKDSIQKTIQFKKNSETSTY